MSDSNLSQWPIQIEVPVQWGDMDALAHVNHTLYIKWMETARMVYFNACGLSELYEKERIGPILGTLEVKYLLPVHFPDVITVSTTVSRLGGSSFDMDYQLTSQQLDGARVATGRAACVIYDYNNACASKMSDALRADFLALEAGGPED
jgi:acyl-CoA thioester hydrolase